jgi:hypothetical protein
MSSRIFMQTSSQPQVWGPGYRTWTSRTVTGKMIRVQHTIFPPAMPVPPDDHLFEPQAGQSLENRVRDNDLVVGSAVMMGGDSACQSVEAVHHWRARLKQNRQRLVRAARPLALVEIPHDDDVCLRVAGLMAHRPAQQSPVLVLLSGGRLRIPR